MGLLRLGPDRIPFEVWLQRRWRFGRKPKRYTYHHPKPEPQAVADPKPDKLVKEEVPATLPTEEIRASPLVALRPVELAWGEIGTYNLIRVWLLVVGIYVVYWIFQGGAEEVAFMLKSLGF